MPDRENVIKWADICLSSAYSEKCNECPYQINHEGLYSCVEGILRDTIAMLKEQEPKQVNDIAQQISCFSGICPNCGKMLNTTCNKNFCGECGQAVKWE